MARPYSLDLRERLIELVKAGCSAREAGRRLKVSASTAINWVKRYRLTGSVAAKPMHGHPPSKLAAHQDLVLQLVADQPDLTLDELRQRLADHGIEVGKSCIHSFLRRQRISFKKKTAHAAEQNRSDVKKLRKAWRRAQPWIDQERLVFLDETALTTKLARLYGRCPVGERLVSAIPHGHWKTLTFIAALRVDRIDAPWIIDGPMNGSAFCTYLSSCLAPTLNAGDIVVMDNLPTHKVPGVRTLLEGVGAQLWYLPPYSPDMNPIENAFAKLKALLRGAAERTIHGLQHQVDVALKAFSATECFNYFRHAGYG